MAVHGGSRWEYLLGLIVLNQAECRRDQASKMGSPQHLLLGKDRRDEIRKGGGRRGVEGARHQDERLLSPMPPDILSQILLFADGATLAEAQLASKVCGRSGSRKPHKPFLLRLVSYEFVGLELYHAQCTTIVPLHHPCTGYDAFCLLRSLDIRLGEKWSLVS